MSILHSKLSSSLLTQASLDRFASCRARLQQALHGFSLGTDSLRPVVLLYGSSVSGTSFSSGDADYAVAFCRDLLKCDHTVNTNEIPREEQETTLSSIFHHMQGSINTQCAHPPQRIYRSRIPIVHYDLVDDDSVGMSFDISLSLDGIRNTLLIRQYVQRSARLRYGFLLVKKWGYGENILNARRGLLSPYALTIMYIFFMQKTGRIDFVVNEKDILLDSYVRTCARNEPCEYFSLLPSLTDTVEAAALDDVKAFFDFFSNDDCFDFDEQIVDIRVNDTLSQKDAWLERLQSLDSENKWHLLGHECLFIRDPFESHNLGRSVDFFRAEKIRESFRVAAVDKLLKYFGC